MRELIGLSRVSVLHQVLIMAFEPPIPVIQVRSNRVCIYDQYLSPPPNRRLNAISLSNLEKEKYTGEMTATAKKNLEKALINWSDTIRAITSKEYGFGASKRVKMVMLTLTLQSQQKHTDAYIKRHILSRYLIVLKRKFNMQNYVWKAEFQENDNIHFHIITDVFIPHSEARSTWNIICGQHGYLDSFKDKFGHENANSTDIHIVKDMEKGFSYLLKYMSKNQCCRLEGGKVWGCSEAVEALKSPVINFDIKGTDFVRDIENNKEFRVVKLDNAKIIYGDVYKLLKTKHKKVFREVQLFLAEQWKWARKLDIEEKEVVKVSKSSTFGTLDNCHRPIELPDVSATDFIFECFLKQ